jgi:hypothetical protein
MQSGLFLDIPERVKAVSVNGAFSSSSTEAQVNMN